MKKYLSHNGNIIQRGANKFIYRNYNTPIPEGMHFLYLANNFDGEKIPNEAIDSTIGAYLVNGTLGKVDSGGNSYITGGSSSNYLYVIMSDDDLNLMKATNNTYTFYFRFTSLASSTGGILCWRKAPPPGSSGGSDGYNYMFRSANNKIQWHTSSGNDTGLYVNIDTVYKAVITNNTCYIVDLNDNTKSYSFTGTFIRTMKPMMTTFWAGNSTEVINGKFYGAAGIPRATTTEEDDLIKQILLTQEIA